MAGKVAEVRAQHSSIVAGAEKRAREEAEKVREREAALIAQTEGIINETRQTVERLEAGRLAADAAGRSMLDAARSAASRCTSGKAASPAGVGQAAGVPSGMSDGDRLMRVLGELDGAAGAYASAADRSRAAGIACERYVEALRR